MKKASLLAYILFAVVLLNCCFSDYAFSFVDYLSKNSKPYLNYNNEGVFKKAFNSFVSGRYKTAAGEFWLYLHRGGKTLGNFALYYQGLSFINLKEYGKADYVLMKLSISYPNFVFYKNTIFYLAISEEKTGNYVSEISHFKYIIARSKKSSVRSFAMYDVYKAYAKLKDYKLADKYLKRLYIDYPYFCKIHHIKIKNAFLNLSEKIKRGEDLYYDSYYTESIAILKTVALKDKKAKLIILKDLMNIKSSLFLDKVDKCLKYEKNKSCYEYYGVKNLKILDLKARYYYISGQTQKTFLILNSISEKYGFLNRRLKNIYGNILWSRILNDLKSGELLSAAKRLKSFFIIDDSVNQNTARFLFWYGIILEKLGYKKRALFYFNLIRASRILRYSYYGIMSDIFVSRITGAADYSSEVLNNGDIRSYSIVSLKYASEFKKAINNNYALNLRFKRLKALLNLNIYSLSYIELRKIALMNDNNKNFDVFLIYLLYKKGYYGSAINIAFTLIFKNDDYRQLLLNKKFLEILYPKPYYGYVEKYSSKYGIPVDLIYGIMRQESLYNPICYSGANAIGLMQIIPSTGYYIASHTGCYNFNPSMLYSKHINISFGSYYLKTLLDQFNGKKYLAIASYNAGPGAVSYWKNNLLKNDAMPLFIELIPFNQTRTYVKRVLANYYVYNFLYN
ncbi:MAG: lytic transglycosylase domain-containing protein [Deltaproteobacteria bacterium]|jgi:soluble lytic murein transglycosylase-like protein|uniref:Lytic transglycosylase domain-containing protein n=1 Tax=Candidatus Acidulodesulfobacterium acidiphilum TaxID=2597224 RepID=A0A520XD39_9DELT|nr:lytic transglycosylase domain-containing protein [Deltaproteobacteria bacterium]RZV39124.1 MAG: lytic transglycosylase domain-containing protein [Candidatus Acidulodesulfobacterium acidiphilum]